MQANMHRAAAGASSSILTETPSRRVGFKDLFENRERDRAYVSVLANLIVSF